jgi:amino acid transporter
MVTMGREPEVGDHAPVRPRAGDPYHPRTAHRRAAGELLRTRDATAMAVGGMIGGGIFSVLGVAITLAGHLAVGCFVLGAALAAVTARSLAGLSARSGRSGGPFDDLRGRGRTGLAGTMVWLLGFGYVVAMAVYSFTFGRYAANALDAPTWAARALTGAIVVAFLVVNLKGVRVSSRTEDLIVAVKLVVLGGIAAIGIAAFAPDRLSPPANEGVLGLFVGAATVFFAYEGFELICFDRGDMVDPGRTLPRALYLSVAIVAAVYVGVTLGAQMLVSDATIAANREVAFVVVGREALGGVGRWAAIVGALFATASAINATLFSCARLVRDASRAHDLPAVLGRERSGQPAVALAAISVGGVLLAMLPGITVVITFGSASFLVIYAVANWLEMRATGGERRIMAGAGLLACVASIALVAYELAVDDPGGLAAIVGIATALAIARAVFVRTGRAAVTRAG